MKVKLGNDKITGGPHTIAYMLFFLNALYFRFFFFLCNTKFFNESLIISVNNQLVIADFPTPYSHSFFSFNLLCVFFMLQRNSFLFHFIIKHWPFQIFSLSGDSDISSISNVTGFKC